MSQDHLREERIALLAQYGIVAHLETLAVDDRLATKALVEGIWAAHQAGLSLRDIAKATHMSHEKVRRICKAQSSEDLCPSN